MGFAKVQKKDFSEFFFARVLCSKRCAYQESRKKFIMKYTILMIFFIIALTGCDKDNGVTQPTQNNIIYTSLTCTDTLGNPKTSFSAFEKFYLTFQMTNKTGKDQTFYFSGPFSEIYISKNDTIVSRQFDGITWAQVINQYVLKAESTYTNKWLAPVNPAHPNLRLVSGTFEADVFFPALNDVIIKFPEKVQFSIYMVIVRKPNIYLYPPNTRALKIKLDFPMGGRILESSPNYLNGWNVTVTPSGKINNTYDFLFYESENPDAFQYKYGWLVNRDTLASFFRNNLYEIGFRGREIDDFLEYWMQHLTDFQFYEIYPQFQEDIEKVIRRNISESPDSMLRMFYVFVGTHSISKQLSTPIIPKFERKGFAVAEWGGVLK